MFIIEPLLMTSTMKNLFRLIKNHKGFTIVELAIVMVVVGLLAGGGIPLMRMLTERKARNETKDYLVQVKEAVISFTNSNGRLPRPDTNNDGQEDPCGTPCRGFLPYIDLNVPATDQYRRTIRYEINRNLGISPSRSNTCLSLFGWNPLSGVRPMVVDQDDPSANQVSVAAIFVSAGPKNADGSGGGALGVFDRINSGTWTGNNITGSPNYIRNPPTNQFDDIVIYIGGLELYQFIECSRNELCPTGITVTNQSTGGLSFQQNGGACQPWGNGANIIVRPFDSFAIFIDGACTMPCQDPYLSYSQLKNIDLDNNCNTGVNPGGVAVDR